jgi:hypothetical protein
LNKNNKNKTSREKSEFANHKKNTWLEVARWTLLGLSALLTANSAYFAGASLVALATGSAFIPVAGWIFIGCLIASSVGLFLFQQATSTFSLLNPAYERFKKLKQDGLLLIAAHQSNKASFNANLQEKYTNEHAASVAAATAAASATVAPTPAAVPVPIPPKSADADLAKLLDYPVLDQAKQPQDKLYPIYHDLHQPTLFSSGPVVVQGSPKKVSRFSSRFSPIST